MRYGESVQRSETGLTNFRDVGGLLTAAGSPTRSGVLYRSDVPLAGDDVPEGAAVWPPRTVVDLRSPGEWRGSAHPLADAAEVRRRPVVTDEVDRGAAAGRELPGNADLGAYFTTMYIRWLERRGDAVTAAVAAVLDSPGPTLVHCAAGRDRTGVVVALLLRAAGVEAGEIVADYRRTEGNIKACMARLARAGALGSVPLDADFVTPAAIEAVLGHVDRTYGGVRGWLTMRGVSEAQLEQWVDRIVGSEPHDHRPVLREADPMP